jgi:hypothetical protein
MTSSVNTTNTTASVEVWDMKEEVAEEEITVYIHI